MFRIAVSSSTTSTRPRGLTLAQRAPCIPSDSLAGESRTRNVVPLPGLDSRSSSPPKERTMLCEMDSARPVPFPTGLVVKNGSNTRFWSSGAMPGPLSLTSITTRLTAVATVHEQVTPETALAPLLRAPVWTNQLPVFCARIASRICSRSNSCLGGSAGAAAAC